MPSCFYWPQRHDDSNCTQPAFPLLPAKSLQTLDNTIHIYQGPYATRILPHYACNGSQPSIKESKWFRKIENHAALLLSRRQPRSWSLRYHQAFREWLTQSQSQALSNHIYTVHLANWASRIATPLILPGHKEAFCHLRTRRPSPDLFLQFHFIWNYYFIMHNKSYNSLPPLQATHTGIPSFTQARDSCLTADSNTTAEFRASDQEYCIPVQLLWHLDQHHRSACAARAISMETTWIMMVQAIHVALYTLSVSLPKSQSSSCCKEQWQHTWWTGLVNRRIELEEQNGLCYASLPLASSF